MIQPVANALGLAFRVLFCTALVVGFAAMGLGFVGGDATARFLWQLAAAALVLAFMAIGFMLLLAMVFD